MTPLKGALFCAQKRLFVFPLRPGTKEPYAGFAWKKLSTRTKGEITYFSNKYPDCNWAVDCGKSGITVLDVDCKNGVDGLRTLQKLDISNNDTFRVSTPNQGFHLYYKEKGLNTANKLGPSLDTRGTGGYVVSPGSQLPSGNYEIEIDTELNQLPKQLKNFFEKIPEKETGSYDAPAETIEPDRQRIESFLKNAQQAVAGQGGNHLSFHTVAKIRDMGTSEADAYDLLLPWNNTCVPPWSEQELRKLIKNAYTYAQNAPATQSIQNLFPMEPKRLLKGSKDAATIVEKDISVRRPVIANRYLKQFVTVTTAAGGGSKSTLLLTECHSVGSNRPLTGMEIVRPGATAFFNLEDPIDEIERRSAAIQKHFQIKPKDLTLWSGYGHDFHLIAKTDHGNGFIENTKLINHLIEFLKERKIQLWCVDPLIKCHPFGENDNNLMDKVLIIMARIAKEADCAVSVAHHERKPAANLTETTYGDVHAGRGASSIGDAARVVHTVGIMNKKIAEKYGIKDRKYFIRIDQAKANLSRPASYESWFLRTPVQLVQGDEVGIIEPVQLKKES